MLTDYHNHLEKGTLSLEYLKQFTDMANHRGIEHFGISEHAYHFYQTADILRNPWVDERRYYDMKDYVALFHQAWREGMDVKMSIEMDYTPGKHKEMEKFIHGYEFDYVIGSIHWIGDFGIDLAEYIEEWDKRDLHETYTKYFDQVVTLAESNLFDIIGHIDLVKIFKYIPKEEEFLLAQYDRATTALANSKTCVEVSTAGLRKVVKELYPDKRLLQMCYQKGIPIVLSSDAHLPKDVGADYHQAIKLAKEVGYQTIMTFSKGERKEVPLG
ncbi:histidinol-phosphatase [Cytobacillus spongiae]|jgi:histidinol-phosphatase (PHP family)|uniref:histidinol-phosphatase n=1 Tax=Cytobacillus spongiae TaxID=2901381 RepID=UPI001F355D0D|nr:histidinol-phosphatase [Cytobacillus spongiae]UII54680.1 histidinol-phosphatase [Cytobacillus spongiae]